ISNNKLIPGSFPASFLTARYIYTPQKDFEIPSLIPSDMKLDLGALYAYRNANPSIIPSITWFLVDGSPLIENIDYTVDSLGMFTFLKSQTQSASAQISYALYPDFRNGNILKTTRISIASAPIAPKMIAKFTSTKSIGADMTFVLKVSETDSIWMDWGNGTIEKQLLKPSPSGSRIPGNKQGDTIRIYSDFATEGNFSVNDVTYFDIRLWDKIEKLDCSRNLISTIDLSKNTSLRTLDLIYNQLSTIDLSKNTFLSQLSLAANQLSTIDLSKNTKLIYLDLGFNQLSTLNLSNNTLLRQLYLTNNSLSTLDLSKNTQLLTLSLSNNKLNIRTLPILRKGMGYTYFPQKPEGILLPQTIN
ncbi:MAG: hypothetical protein RRX93_08610, partial [Bacteroidales bacterium]